MFLPAKLILFIGCIGFLSGLTFEMVLAANSAQCASLFEKSEIIEYGVLDAQMSQENPGWDVYFLGEGATGRVFRFKSTIDSKVFVRKIIKENISTKEEVENIIQFQKNAEGIEGLRVVKVLDYSKSFIDLESVQGKDLSFYIDSQHPKAKHYESRYLEISKILEERIKRNLGALRVEAGNSILEWAYIIPPAYSILSLKRDNILIDALTGDLVIIDTY
ncbi:MAG: hypothetical protein V4596_10880 [Bdellovibrionota bacterium]